MTVGGLALAWALLLAPRTHPAPSVDPIAALREAADALANGEPESALRLLAKLERGPLGDHVARLEARILREANRLDEALAAAERGLSHDPPSELGAELHRERALVHLARGDFDAARAAQRQAWETSQDAALRARLVAEIAEAFDDAQRHAEALELHRTVWRRWPRSDPARHAYERSRELARAAADAPLSTTEVLRHAEALRRARIHDRALAIYDELAARELTSAQRRRVTRGRAESLFARRRYAEAIDAYRAIVKEDPTDEQAAILVGRSYARAGFRDEALAAFRAAADRGGPSTKAHADYLSAIVLEDVDPARAEQRLRQVETQTASPALRNEARWWLAWRDIEQDRNESALERLEHLDRGPLSDIEIQRARYWKAVVQLRLGDDEAGRRGLGEIAESIPLSYYGILAAERLGRAATVERPLVEGSPQEAGNPLRARRARWLFDGGFPEPASVEIESWLRQGALTRSDRIAASRLLHDVGDPYRAVRTIVDGFEMVFERGIDPGWREAWELAWPIAFAEPVRDAVKEFDFDAALVYAVMREESVYQPQVASNAGALGLMQIIPPTGRRIAEDLGVPGFEPQALLDPRTNVRFGTFYLKYLHNRFEGAAPHMIAAYNAGPDIVSQWLSRQGPRGHDAFVEAVPYGETRRYLRRVLRSRHIYERLYGEGLVATTGIAPPQSSPTGRR
jgi:soluble lytic murein transglycosylase